ncbi:putative ribonuclease H-like domain-containing protein [Tanacetum coccineum]
MTGNKCYLDEYEDYDGGFVSFGDGKGIISGKGKIKIGSLDFEDVCLVLSSNFKLLDESQVLLRVPRKDNIYSVDLKSVVPTRDLTCLIAKATIDEFNTWHRRLGHINFKTMNKLVKENLVKGLPSKIFENDHSCVACQKGKQHKASYKTKLVNSISKPLHMLHMDLFGLTNVKSLTKKSYCLVVTDDFSRFSWVFFLASKDETSGILKTFITEIENQLDHKVKVIRSNNRIEFKNSIMNQFCEIKGIKREFCMARTPQKNGVAERKNRTLIEAARTMDAGMKPTEVDENQASNKSGKHDQEARSESERLNQREMQTEYTNSSNGINTVSTPVSTVGPSFDTIVSSTPINTVGPFVSTANESEEQLFEIFSPFKNAFTLPPVSNVSSMDNTGIFGNAYDDEDVKEEVDMNNVISSYTNPDTSFTKFHKDHPEDQVIGSLKTPVQTRHMTKINEEHGLFSSVHKLRRTNHKDFQNCLFACFLSQMEPKKPVQALKVWTLVDLPRDKWEIGTKWVFRNKKDERGIVEKNKARLVAQGHTQEEVIDYDDVFAPVARIEAIRLFLAYASLKDFVVYQMDVKSAFLYGKIEEEVYVCQLPCFKDPHFADKVYKVEKALYGLHQAPRACQDKYVAEILKKFDFASVKTASTHMETIKALIKDKEVEDVDVHLYRSMIGSLMYLTASRPDIMFAVCACARDSPFDLEAYSDSDYAGASLDRNSTTGGCQFLGKRLISWQYRVKTSKDKHIEFLELGDRMERAATTASSLEAKQDSSGPRCQDTILGDVDAQTRFKTTSKQSNDPPLLKVNTFGSGEDSMQLMELMTHYTKLSALIVDFLNANPIRYALTINPTIYISCIQQFWDPAKLITVNGDIQIQALIDGKKIIVNEASIRRDLKLEDAEGSQCLPNATIFEGLTRMGYEKVSQKLTFYKAFFSPQWKFLIHTIMQCISAKTTAWNEFSSTMTSAIICLANNQKFNFSKYIFDSMVKNLENVNKFWMYPRFVQVFVNQQLGDMSKHKKAFVNPSLTKKLFGNMKREGTRFSRKITPLFDTIMVQASEEVGEDSDHPTDSNQIPIVDQPSTSSQPKKKQKSKRKHRKEAKVAHDETEHEESVPTPSNDPLPSAIEIASLKKRIERLKRRSKLRTTRLRRLKKVGTTRRIESSNDSLGAQEDASKHGRRIKDIDVDAEVTLVNETQERQDEDLMFDTGVLDDDEVFVDVTTVEKEEQSTKTGEAVTTAGVEDSVAPTIPTTVEETLAQTLMEIKAAKPKAKGIVFHDLEKQVSKPTVSVTQPSIKDKGKGIMQEPERPLTKKDQVALDEDLARNIQAQLDAEIIEEERLERQKQEEANIALIESWENTQAMMEADRLLAERLQTREREELTDEEKGKLFMELMEKRRKHFAALRAQEKRNRPPTKAQKRSQMSTYLKHMGGYKHKQLMGKSYDEIQKLFDKEMKRVNTFVAMSSEAQESNEKKVEGSEEKAKSSRKKSLGKKRAVKKQQQESLKRQKVEDDKETDEHEEVEADDTAELKKHLVIKKDDDITIDAIPLAIKPPVIVDYKLLKEGMMAHYQLIRADGSFKRYSSMIRPLQGIDREDLQTLWKLVKKKHGDLRPKDEHERVS